MPTREPLIIVSEPGGDLEPAPFTPPQFGFFAQGTRAHHFLEFDLKPGPTAVGAAYCFAPSLNALNELAGKD